MIAVGIVSFVVGYILGAIFTAGKEADDEF